MVTGEGDVLGAVPWGWRGGEGRMGMVVLLRASAAGPPYPRCPPGYLRRGYTAGYSPEFQSGATGLPFWGGGVPVLFRQLKILEYLIVKYRQLFRMTLARLRKCT